MGKKRIVTTEGGAEKKDAAPKQVSAKKRVDAGVLYVQSTYNNTKVLLTDIGGNALIWSSCVSR